MSCYHPLIAHWSTDKKRPIKVIGSVDRYPITDGVSVDPRLDLPLISDDGTFNGDRDFLLPCGQCVGCRLDRSRSWADRLVMESMSYPDGESWFVTLTYDDDHLIISDKGYPTVKMDEVTAFVKRLRRTVEYHQGQAVAERIRFFAASEYGDQSHRPHYHLIIFGLQIPDLVKRFNNFQGDPIYSSEWIASIWQRGIVAIGAFCWQTAAYTARYIMKKQTGDRGRELVDLTGIELESTRMSRNPGIGRKFFEDHFTEIYTEYVDDHGVSRLQSRVVLPGNPDAIAPKYFDRLIGKDDPVYLRRLKQDRRRIAEQRADCLAHHRELSEREYFATQERKMTNATKKLLRGLDKTL